MFSFVGIGPAPMATAWYIFNVLPLRLFEWIGYPIHIGSHYHLVVLALSF